MAIELRFSRQMLKQLGQYVVGQADRSMVNAAMKQLLLFLLLSLFGDIGIAMI